jgi:hypothetical protein
MMPTKTQQPKSKSGGKMARNKGKRGELEAAELLRQVFPDCRRRVVNHKGVEDGRDLENTGAFAVQVKRHARPASLSHLDKITAAGIPLLVTRGDGGKWIAALPLDDFIRILGDVAEAY